MSGRKAKLLRRTAEAGTVGLVKVDYIQGNPRRLSPRCTRYWYKRLKRAYLSSAYA